MAFVITQICCPLMSLAAAKPLGDQGHSECTRQLNTYITLMLWVWDLVLCHRLFYIVKSVLLMQHAHLPRCL